MTYLIVENAGYEGECDVKRCASHRAALAWIKRAYFADEVESLHVAVCVERPNGARSYEI